MSAKHCPACRREYYSAGRSGKWSIKRCPGIVCSSCAEKDAEIAKLTADLDALRKEYVRLQLDLEVAYRGLGTKH